MAATADPRAPRKRFPWLALLPALALILIALAVPVADMTLSSLHREDLGQPLPGYTLYNYLALFTNPQNLTLFIDTFLTAAVVTLLCAALGFPVAAVISRAPQKWRGVLYFLVAAPLLVNTVVRTYGWLLILGRKGLLNDLLIAAGLLQSPLALTGNYLGMIIGGTQVFLPFMILSLATSLMSIDRHLLEASEMLGAGALRRFFTITLPLAVPGLVAGSVLVFSLMLGAFVTPLILGGTAIKYLSIAVYTDALVLFNLPQATALSLLLMLVVLLAYYAQKRFTPRENRP